MSHRLNTDETRKELDLQSVFPSWQDTRVSRREFLAATSLAVVTVGATDVSPSARETAASGGRRIRIGFLGATHSHADGKLAVVRRSEDYELIGVCEEAAQAREHLRQRGIQLLSQTALLDQCEVIAVESPVRDHARHALLALRAGKHVHLEKPPTTTWPDMEAIVALAREKRLRLQVGYMWRYHPGFAVILEAVRRGWLGEVFLVRAALSNGLAPARRAEWAQFPGGAWFELASHLVDVVVRMLGRPKNVTPILRRHGNFADTLKDNNAVILEYGATLAVLTNTALQDTKLSQRYFEVLGTNGTAVMCPLEPPALEMELTSAAGPHAKGLHAVPLPAYNRYEADFAALARAVRGQETLSVSLDTELEVHETLLRTSKMLGPSSPNPGS